MKNRSQADGPRTLVIMYHYVQPNRDGAALGSVPLELEAFERQLDFLQTLGPITPADRIRDALPRERYRIILTFDDGTRDHYEHVFPILLRRGLSGLFGIISAPFLEYTMPNVHLCHYVLSQTADEQLWAALCQRVPAELSAVDRRAGVFYWRDTPLRARIKYVLNFLLAPGVAREFLIEYTRRCCGDVPELARRWYLTEDHILEMHQAGMAFAVHGHRHLPFQAPADRFHRDELQPCLQWLTDLLGEVPRHYIAAFGGSNAGGDTVRDLQPILRNAGFLVGYLTSSGCQPLESPEFFYRRIDTADLPPRVSAAEFLERWQL